MILKIKNSLFAILIMSSAYTMMSCKKEKDSMEKAQTTQEHSVAPFFKLSLAQWSFHDAIQNKGMDPYNFTREAKRLGFEGVEFVTKLYDEFYEGEKPIEGSREALFDNWIKRINEEAEKNGIKNLLIMIDDEGDLADPDSLKRNEAVENHKKWVDAAAATGCHSVRVNTFGTNDPEEWKETCADGLKKLSEYAATKNVNVLVENHGWLSSNPPLVMEVLNGINMDNLGTLPDFGNWCIKRPDDSRWNGCAEEYPDRYGGIEMMMPRAKAVSAKANEFDSDGNETSTDYYRMLKVVKDAGYTGYIGVEFEGSLPEKEGIVATKELLLKAAAKLK